MVKTVFSKDGLKFYLEDNQIKCRLYGIFEFIIEKKEIIKIANEYKINNENELILIDDIELDAKIRFLITSKIENELINTINKRKAIFIDSHFHNFPLLGSNNIGIVDRNTSLIELKPITGCNINCIFCSVNECFVNEKRTDFVIEYKYLVDELKKHIENYKKDCNNIEIHINCNGEPLLYDKICELIYEIKKIKQIYKISLDTNAVLLDEKFLNKLISSGLNQLNISLHSLNSENAKILAGTKNYDLDKIVELIKQYKDKIQIIIAPVMIFGKNEKDIEELVQFCKKFDLKIGIQNYLLYDFGRKISKQLSWDEFYEILKKMEEKYNIKLILNADDFKIIKTENIKKPFKKGNNIKCQYLCPGHLENSLFFFKDNRLITVFKEKKKISDFMNIKITRDKHNIFYGIFT